MPAGQCHTGWAWCALASGSDVRAQGTGVGPKGLCPTRQAGRSRDRFSTSQKQREIFADVGQRHKRIKTPSWCRKLRAKPRPRGARSRRGTAQGCPCALPHSGRTQSTAGHELSPSTQSCCTHHKQPGTDSSKEVSGEGPLLTQTAFLTGGPMCF